MPPTLQILPSARFDDIVAVMCDAFHDYPVMRFVVGAGHDYDDRLRRLITFFVLRRERLGAALLGLVDGQTLLA